MPDRDSERSGPSLVESQILRLSKRLGITQAELASLAGFEHGFAAKAVVEEVDAALSRIALILDTAAEMAGDNGGILWFKHQPIPGWSGNTAYDLVKEGSASQVLEYFEAVRAGVYALPPRAVI